MRKKEILSYDEAFNQLLLKDRRFQLTLTAVKKAPRQLFAQQKVSYVQGSNNIVYIIYIL